VKSSTRNVVLVGMEPHVLLIGKHPPVQGGTSNQFLWLTKWLAELGVGATVVDASYAFDPHERCAIDDDDWRALVGRHPSMFAIRRVALQSDLADVPTIPRHESLVTRLVAAALGEIERSRPIGVISNFLDPYGVAAHQVARATGLAFAYRHAGSDLFYQLPAPTRSAAYREVLRDADLVLSSTMHSPLVRRAGAMAEGIRTHLPILTPATEFSPEGPSLDLRDRGAAMVIGMAGKLGDGKGFFEMVEATAVLRAEGHDLRLAVLTGSPGGSGRAQYERLVAAKGLAEHIEFVDFLPHWRVAEFMRSCDLVTFLEHDFHVRGHRPSYAREALSCGRPVLLSTELKRQLRLPPGADTAGIFAVDDPDSVAGLCMVLRTIVDRRDELGELAKGSPALAAWTDASECMSWVAGLVDDLTFAESIRRRHHVLARRLENKIDLDAAAEHLMRGELDALLRQRRLRFLERTFASIFGDHPQLQTAVRTDGVDTSSADLARSIDSYAAALRMAAAETFDGAEGLDARSRIDLLHVNVSLRFAPSVVAPVAVAPGRVQVAPGARLLSLPTRPGGGTAAVWRIVVWPSEGPFGRAVRTVEISASTFEFLQQAREPVLSSTAASTLGSLTHERLMRFGVLLGGDGGDRLNG
jgi:glycosyltransferase involved in cell wall biosynthesis